MRLLLLLFTAFLAQAGELAPIRLSEDRARFVRGGRDFIAWGCNYDHDDAHRLIEDYWDADWAALASDFQEMKALGANVVRVHLQLGRFMTAPDAANPRALAQLTRLVTLAETTGLYLDITGLGCYHKAAVPAWYDALSEAKRWQVQAAFWRAVAKTCRDSNAIFCYDLMNEPILPGNSPETDWLAGAFGGKHFVQRISLDLAGRTREAVAQAWVETLVAAIRSQDSQHLITVGVIPWVHSFPKAKPLFYAKEIAASLDFVSVHFYPSSGEVDKALTALAAYDIGKPLVIEEMFPLKCSIEEMADFIERSRPIVEGWISFYWGKQIDEYSSADGIGGAITKRWLSYFRDHPPAQ